jgi:hypothetical protein
MLKELIGISMVDVCLKLLMLRMLAHRKEKSSKELIRISVGGMILLRFVFDSTGILVAQ